MDEKYIQTIYDQLGGNSKFGDFNDFRTLITMDPGYRKTFHNSFGDKVLGSYNDCESLVKKKDLATGLAGPSENQGSLSPEQFPVSAPGVLEQPAASVPSDTVSVAAPPEMQPNPSRQSLDEIPMGVQPVQPGFAGISFGEKQPSIDFNQIQKKNEEQKLFEHLIEGKPNEPVEKAHREKVVKELQTSAQNISSTIDDEIKNVWKDAKEKGVFMGGSSNSNILPNDNEHKQKLEVLHMAKGILDKVQDFTEAEDPSVMGDFIRGVTSQGFVKALPFIGGLSDLPELQKIKEAALNEDRTPEEGKLLTAEAIRQQFEQNKNKSYAYRAGEALASMAPYIGEYATTVGAYTGVKAVTMAGLESVLKGAAQKAIVKNGVIKPISTLVGIAAQTAVNPQQYIKTTYERMTPQVKLTLGMDDNELKAVVGQDKEEFAKAFTKAFGVASLEFLTERFGQWSNEAGAAMKISDKWLPQVILAKWMEKKGLTDLTKAKSIAHRIGYDGMIQEIWFEEYPNKILQNAVTGDQKWDKAMFNPLSQEFIDMIPATMIMGGGPMLLAKGQTMLGNYLEKVATKYSPQDLGKKTGEPKPAVNEKPKGQAPEPQPAPVPETPKEAPLPVQSNEEKPKVQEEPVDKQAEEKSIEKWLEDQDYISYSWDGETLEISKSRDEAPTEISRKELIEQGVIGSAPKAEVKTEPVPDDLEDRGEEIVSTIDAERRFGAGERIFAFHEQDPEHPYELNTVEEIRKNTSDQLLAYPGVDQTDELKQQKNAVPERSTETPVVGNEARTGKEVGPRVPESGETPVPQGGKEKAPAEPDTPKEEVKIPERAKVGSDGTLYFPSHTEAFQYAKENGYPTDRIINYDKGHAIQIGKAGTYATGDKTKDLTPSRFVPEPIKTKSLRQQEHIDKLMSTRVPKEMRGKQVNVKVVNSSGQERTESIHADVIVANLKNRLGLKKAKDGKSAMEQLIDCFGGK